MKTRVRLSGQGVWRLLLPGACVVFALLCSSCVTYPPPERGPADVLLPASFTLYAATAPVPERWWESFGSEELTQLVSEALGGNFTLAQARARLRQASSVARQAGALRWPELGYSADASVARVHTDTGQSQSGLETASQKLGALNTLLESGTGTATNAQNSVSAGVRTAQTRLQALDTLFSEAPSSETTTTNRSYGLGLTTSYEADLWGRVRAGHEASLLDMEAAREDVHAAMQSLVGQVVLTWLDILMDKQVLVVVRSQLEANETQLELAELRYRKSMATALDVYQQRQAVAQIQAVLPPLEAQLETLQHELAVLLGKVPRADLGLAASTFPDAGPLPGQGLPADLLAQRPDVRSAGIRLQAADWRVSAARADRLPAVRLSGSASYGANEWELLFDNWMATLAGSLTGPIFDAGRRKAEVERTRAVVDERLAAYRQTVLTAVAEVENALVLEAKQGAYIAALRTQFETAQSTHREALARYRKGLNDYLPVLSALTNAQALERSLVQAEHDLLVYRVQLHLALGGTWMRDAATDNDATEGECIS